MMIYLDNFATTQIDPLVLETMMPWLTEKFGNPSSRSHSCGWEAEEAVETAREQVAELINCDAEQVIFTSGATESNNIVLNAFKRRCVSAIEHSSVYWAHETVIPVQPNGIVSIGKYNDLISVMLANNEVGTIQPVEQFEGIKHSDIAQALGKIKVDVKELGLNYASMSAHKIYGPKGVGALYVGKNIMPLMYGGSQEFGYRPGTLNVAGIVGFGKACEIAGQRLGEETIGNLRDILYNKLCEGFGEELKRHGENVLPGALNVVLPCKDMDLFINLISDKVALSMGSACMSHSPDGSRVLKAMGIPQDERVRSIRLCVGRFNTSEEIFKAADYIVFGAKGGKR